MWFKKFILRIVRPVVTWVQSLKNTWAWAELEPHLSNVLAQGVYVSRSWYLTVSCFHTVSTMASWISSLL